MLWSDNMQELLKDQTTEELPNTKEMQLYEALVTHIYDVVGVYEIKNIAEEAVSRIKSKQNSLKSLELLQGLLRAYSLNTGSLNLPEIDTVHEERKKLSLILEGINIGRNLDQYDSNPTPPRNTGETLRFDRKD